MLRVQNCAKTRAGAQKSRTSRGTDIDFCNILQYNERSALKIFEPPPAFARLGVHHRFFAKRNHLPVDKTPLSNPY